MTSSNSFVRQTTDHSSVSVNSRTGHFVKYNRRSAPNQTRPKSNFDEFLSGAVPNERFETAHLATCVSFLSIWGFSSSYKVCFNIYRETLYDNFVSMKSLVSSIKYSYNW